MATTAELEADLQRVRDAIARLESGEGETRLGDRWYSEIELQQLYQRESRLEVRIGRKKRGGIRARQGIVRV